MLPHQIPKEPTGFFFFFFNHWHPPTKNIVVHWLGHQSGRCPTISYHVPNKEEGIMVEISLSSLAGKSQLPQSNQFVFSLWTVTLVTKPLSFFGLLGSSELKPGFISATSLKL